ncbi:MAG: AMP-binding protein [Nocardioides sp.]|uniref:AMP-binding protein n=1 Tax=Nocardioides sp. TaxID=35761 RepID=UPI003F0C39AC
MDSMASSAGAGAESASRPWVIHYGPGVRDRVDLPDEAITAGLVRAARRWPDRVAVDFLGATTTYAQLDDRIRRTMTVLAGIGVGEGDRVALSLPNCASHVIAFHAALRLGAVVVELNPTYTTGEMAHLLADSGATTVLAWRHGIADVVAARDTSAVQTVIAVDVAKDLPRTAQLMLRLPVSKAKEKRAALDGPVPDGVADFHRLVDAAAPSAAEPLGASADLALLQYTGGTTGTPKAARLTHRNLVANVVHGQEWAGFTEGGETVYGVLPFFHAFGLTFCLTLPGHIGATLVAFPNFDPPAVIAAQKRRPATFLAGVAPMYDRIVDALEADRRPPAEGLRSIRLGFAGAMPIPRHTVERWEAATGGLLIEGYGMTECAPIALGNPCSPARRPGTLGVPFPNTDMRVVDQDDHTVEAVPAEDGSVRGELLVRGPQVFDGYWNRPDETAGQLLEGGWLCTGDVVRVEADGWVTLVDRVKEMIIVGGFKVYPSQVEDHLRTMEGILDVAAVGLPHGDEEQVAVAVVLVESAPAPTLEELRAYAEQRLPRYALPRAVTVVDDLPRSQIGKVMRRLVREQMLQE